MAVYVDKAQWPWRGKLWAHLSADTLDELHDFAARLGLRRDWFQLGRSGRWPHYDVTERKRAQAIRLGALELTQEKFVEIYQRAKAQER